ncbi:CheR family methyltransferase [Thermophagus sp. OGC60D27]|uniref:CheR family methyltransferase n=1 Tax=Thermophagus sp. OGC60D27 TaxID=3458415 RepID=UPI00403770AD
MGFTFSIKEIKSVTSEMARYESLDYTGHSFSFLKRRLGHVFSELRVRKLNQLSELLKDENFREKINYHMAVNVTEMFRDPGFWRVLRQDIFPLFKEENWSVWFPDASSGEEVFSLLVLLKEEGLIDSVDVLCQHPSKEKCQEISQGMLDLKKLDINLCNYRRLEENTLFENYFIDRDGRKLFSKDLLKGCRYRSEALGEKENNEQFDLILFRNSGINYTARKKEEIFEGVLKNLKPGGVIALGVRENVPDPFRNQVKVLNQKESIFRKI